MTIYPILPYILRGGNINGPPGVILLFYCITQTCSGQDTVRFRVRAPNYAHHRRECTCRVHMQSVRAEGNLVQAFGKFSRWIKKRATSRTFVLPNKSPSTYRSSRASYRPKNSKTDGRQTPGRRCSCVTYTNHGRHVGLFNRFDWRVLRIATS